MALNKLIANFWNIYTDYIQKTQVTIIGVFRCY